MNSQGWLPLTEYANKYKVSISTLRRRVRDHKAEWDFVNGKYYLKDLPLKQHSSGNKTEEDGQSQTPPTSKGLSPQNNPKRSGAQPILKHKEPLLFSSANRLLDELKKAYMMALQEKEEQIIVLKEEVADLKTLVKVLENENKRLQSDSYL